MHVLPYFHDSHVAFVQSPQHYVNKMNLVSTGSAEAQRIFYELVCPGKNNFNAAFCVGTNAMFRREALDEIGGIAIGSNSEDIWTSLELHKLGWQSIYVPAVLARFRRWLAATRRARPRRQTNQTSLSWVSRCPVSRRR